MALPTRVLRQANLDFPFESLRDFDTLMRTLFQREGGGSGAGFAPYAVDIREDRNQDPFAVGYREFLAPEARALVEELRARRGYRTYRERKLVCTRGIAPRLRALLEEMGKPCVIYTL